MNRNQRRLAHKGQGDFGSPKPAAAVAVKNLFADACRHHQAGRLQEAERACRQFLAVSPRNADGLFLLGMIAYQSGRHAAAIDLIGQAIGLRDDVPVYHNNLGVALGELGRFGEAAAHYQRALTLKPDYAEAHNNLGIALKEQGKLDEAIAHYQHAVALKPGYAEAHNNLGNGLKQQGKLNEAMAHYRPR
jgi:tetratricopeptide (TPR) repeat protein